MATIKFKLLLPMATSYFTVPTLLSNYLYPALVVYRAREVSGDTRATSLVT